MDTNRTYHRPELVDQGTIEALTCGNEMEVDEAVGKFDVTPV
jgi:hypothetical protein